MEIDCCYSINNSISRKNILYLTVRSKIISSKGDQITIPYAILMLHYFFEDIILHSYSEYRGENVFSTCGQTKITKTEPPTKTHTIVIDGIDKRAANATICTSEGNTYTIDYKRSTGYTKLSNILQKHPNEFIGAKVNSVGSKILCVHWAQVIAKNELEGYTFFHDNHENVMDVNHNAFDTRQAEPVDITAPVEKVSPKTVANKGKAFHGERTCGNNSGYI